MEEDKRLDLDQPFLSVRRFSPAAPTPESKAKSMRTVRAQPKPPQPPPPYRSELKSGPLREPGTVPFTWEQSPGRPKYEGLISPDQSRQRPPIAPKLPPGRATPKPKQTEPNKASDDIPKDTQSQESLTSDSVIAKEERPDESTELGTTSDAEEETYFDAQDNLSRSESFYFNCSISGLSGLDGPDVGSRGTFATDPQVQDFMMGRFLPAAKAMASETPPHSHAPRKQPPPVAREQPRLRLKKASNVNKQQPLYRYNSSFISRYMKQMSGLESEDDDDEIEPENPTAKVCGLFPRFMLKSSFCILDPAQDIGPQNVEKLSKPSKTNRPAHKTDLRNKEVLARKIEPSASRSILQEDKGGEEKGCKSFRDLLASEGDEWKSTSGSRGPVAERTLYIDSVRTVNSRSSETSSVSGPPSYRGIDFDANAVGHVESLPRDIKEIAVVDEKEIQTSPVDASHNEIKQIVFREEKEIPGHESVEPIMLICSESRKFVTCPADENIDIEPQPVLRSNPKINSRPSRPTFHIPPLLPKSPADSWLFRTLPSVPSRNSPARFSPSSHETDRFQVPTKPPLTAVPKWESMIKTSRPSLDSLAPIPES